MARISGWIAMGLIVAAAIIPLLHRLRAGKRAAPHSKPISFHVALGLGVAVVAFTHTLVAVLALGSASAIGAGVLGLGAGAAAFLLLLAHTGLGLQLRRPRLRNRNKVRRSHVVTAISITVAAILHTVLLLRAAE